MTNITQIKEKITKFQYTSLEYEDNLDGFSVLQDDASALILYGYNAAEEIYQYHWAANNAQEIISAITAKNCLVTFVPSEWVKDFETHGFAVRSIWRDYWRNSLDDIKQTSTSEFLSLNEAKAASEVTKACKNLSRGFHGETEEWITEWLSGSDGDIKNTAGIIKRNENKDIVGVIFTAVYAYESEKGPVAWLREVAVKPEFQKQGIARELMSQALYYCKTRGAVRAFLAADDCNEHAIHLYKSLGFLPKTNEQQIDMIRGENT